jgi:hypothetical protein
MGYLTGNSAARARRMLMGNRNAEGRRRAELPTSTYAQPSSYQPECERFLDESHTHTDVGCPHIAVDDAPAVQVVSVTYGNMHMKMRVCMKCATVAALHFEAYSL